MPAEETARALQRTLRTTVSYRCTPQENDGTVALNDVDYLCEPVHDRLLPGYWVGTSDDAITGMLSTG